MISQQHNTGCSVVQGLATMAFVMLLLLQGLSATNARQLDKLEVSKKLAAFSDPKLVGAGDAAFHRALCERLYRAVCTVTSQSRT